MVKSGFAHLALEIDALMARRLFTLVLAVLTALTGVVVSVSGAGADAPPVVMPTEVRIDSVQSVTGNGPPARGTIIQVIGQVMAMPEFQGPMSNVPGNRGTVTISRQLVGEAGFTPMVTTPLIAYGRFVVQLPAVRNASYQVSYSGWQESRDPAALEPIGCDTPCDRMAHYEPSISAVAFGGVTRNLQFGQPRMIGRRPAVYWKRIQLRQRVAISVSPNYSGRRVIIQRQVGCLGSFHRFAAPVVRANGRVNVDLRRGSVYSCFRFQISGDNTYAPSEQTRRLGGRGWMRLI